MSEWLLCRDSSTAERERTTPLEYLGTYGKLALCVCLSMILSDDLAVAGVVTSAVNPANGHTYYLLDATTWTLSEAEAVSLGGHLVTINDADENAWVDDTFKAFGDSFWIGYSDAASEGSWVWADGDLSDFTNWGEVEPDSCSELTAEDWACFVTNGIGFLGPSPVPNGGWADCPDSPEEWCHFDSCPIPCMSASSSEQPMGIVEIQSDPLSDIPALSPLGYVVMFGALAVAGAHYLGIWRRRF